MSKKRWVTVQPYTKTLHWAKSEASSDVSKCISVVGCAGITLGTATSSNAGYGKLRVEPNPGTGAEGVTLEVYTMCLLQPYLQITQSLNMYYCISNHITIATTVYYRYLWKWQSFTNKLSRFLAILPS